MPDCPNRPHGEYDPYCEACDRISNVPAAATPKPSDSATLAAKIAEMEKERRALMLRIVVRTKHGPQGRGDNGPCDKDCLKCEAELFLRKT